ncbi:hypothetical protein BDY21DRAFT_371751 [Lineolata rhizophorae]|uniref:Uncharacterized protein n=1 Tax=Lineolata rhizophorae TaxID=578093 RepID=A0A6A6P0U4_9PEZI|nr:hypothetical protein BDY21DRAFT_371751 [Lineolata rhizophorae]
MASASHSRNTSADTTASGSSLASILDHVLSYPATYEIPLRTMYTLNCVSRAQQQPGSSAYSRSPSPTAAAAATTAAIAAPPPAPSSSPASAHSQNAPWSRIDPQGSANFTASLMQQLSHSKGQPLSLPPSFITSFVRRAFPVELHWVDFPQALAALDYLKDLEQRRRREIAAALRRLGIDRTADAAGDVLDKSPEAAAWVQEVYDKDRKAEALYSQVYVSLRRWILINEMSLAPFNKHNCMAMLNTLYPPMLAVQPTSQLKPDVLLMQRESFFRYINGVEKNGTDILRNVMQQGKKPEAKDGWSAVHETLDMYLRVANRMIQDCQACTGIEYLIPEEARRKGRKVDSGVSFGSDQSRRPSTSGGSASSGGGHHHHHQNQPSVGGGKPLPAPPKEQQERPRTPGSSLRPETPTSRPYGGAAKGYSTLERIARELKKMRAKHRLEVEEMVHIEAVRPEQPKSPVKSLKKMKSMGALGELKQQNNLGHGRHGSGLTRSDSTSNAGRRNGDVDAATAMGDKKGGVARERRVLFDRKLASHEV